MGDRISIKTKKANTNSNGISITGVGNTFFTLRFETAEVLKNGVLFTNDGIKSAWIPEYKDLESTLSFNLGTSYTLYVNGVLATTANTTLNDVRPTDSGMFVINIGGSSKDGNSIILAKTGPI